MKYLISIFFIVILGTQADATELKSYKLKTLVANSLNQFFESETYHDHDLGIIFLGPEDIVSEIIAAQMNAGKATQMTILSTGTIYFYDYEFGDPVGDYWFECTTTLFKNQYGNWNTRDTLCDY